VLAQVCYVITKELGFSFSVVLFVFSEVVREVMLVLALASPTFLSTFVGKR
jgi:hypothetical protein